MADNPNVAVILSGCGVYDGAEINESVCTMLAIDRHGGRYSCFAPDIKQMHVLNHMTGEEMPEERNVLIEASRVARGEIQDLKQLVVDDFDAVIFPGGFGAAKNLSTFAADGADCQVNEQVARVIQETVDKGKPLGALCIAPVLVAKVLGAGDMTIGDNTDVSSAIETMGACHKETRPGELVIDEARRIVTAPCYMYDPCRLSIIYEGAEGAVRALLAMVRGEAIAAAE